MKLAPAALVLALASSAHAAGSGCEGATKPTTLEGWVRQGDCLREAKQQREAVAAYWRGLAVQPAGSKDLYLGMAESYSELGKTADLYAAAQSALRFDGADPDALYWVGIYFELIEDYEEALTNFRKVVTISPSHVRAQRNIGFVLLQQHRPAEAVAALEAALQIDANDWKAHLNLSTAYDEAYKALDDELQAFVKLGGHKVSPREMELPDLMRAIPYHALALEHSRQAARLNPSDFIVQYGLGRRLMDDPKNFPEAIEALQRAVEIRPQYSALISLAYAQQQVGRTEAAYETAKRARKMSNQDIWLIVIMGQLELEMKRFEAAETSFRAALAIDNGRWDASVLLAKALQGLGRATDAKVEIDKAKEIHPEMTQVIEYSFSTP